ncbi:DNA-binding protein [Frankia sp. CNm7]|uniref:DNA-binding protein n=2 Tax=Frankia nepalensis TaxID=1836974 RepID=A0A937RRV1_9ACTN|nr:DNA-binding protein [Frankia nepalensis]MBL7512354.1 DNA-binding protein [Frankia nepalensis]MBL7522583.1 DNA-binding protein [Frankia nepalensis]MBL7632214.1 DNA-binding protein [Frankia nepalensis]
MKRLGRSRTRCFQLTKRPTFPKPAGETGLGRIWRKADLDTWIDVHRPRDLQQRAEGNFPDLR